jgi:hypothetical protein
MHVLYKWINLILAFSPGIEVNADAIKSVVVVVVVVVVDVCVGVTDDSVVPWTETVAAGVVSVATVVPGAGASVVEVAAAGSGVAGVCVVSSDAGVVVAAGVVLTQTGSGVTDADVD